MSSSAAGHEPPGKLRVGGRLSPEEFDDLFRAWYPRMVSQAFLLSGGRLPLAQDAAQEAFVKCWRRLTDPHAVVVNHWPAWLRVTVINETFAALKKEAPVRHANGEELDRAEQGVDPAAHLDLKDAYRTVCRHIAQLSDRQREVVARCALGGQPLKETAVIMGISEGTARAHLYRARQALDPVWTELKAMGVLDDSSEGGQ
ncbi:RNA polymerase sigma factor [Actinacidiphila glaucinigra]|uniref:RNA polymerase sigma factor n=1 Tax=Actinacidiphila glaucinigra TaxID=235986 RepID=UPI00366D8D53